MVNKLAATTLALVKNLLMALSSGREIHLGDPTELGPRVPLVGLANGRTGRYTTTVARPPTALVGMKKRDPVERGRAEFHSG
jgi:hypothetical protein